MPTQLFVLRSNVYTNGHGDGIENVQQTIVFSSTIFMKPLCGDRIPRKKYGNTKYIPNGCFNAAKYYNKNQSYGEKVNTLFMNG